MATVEIVSFGFLHDAAPAADVLVDVRPFRDPHAAASLRFLTANDAPVREAVLATPGVVELIHQSAAEVSALPGDVITVSVGCQGGRHRAPTVAREIAARLIAAGHGVTLRHRDLDKPVVQR